MKLNKVEIQAFRIYNHLKDGTFDFTVEGQPADFVSIYAPNGFGKTSFYDAIEWGVTGDVRRLSAQKDNIKKDKKLSRKGPRPEDYMLINDFAEEGTPTSVSIQLDNGDSISNVLGGKRSSSSSVDPAVMKRILLDQDGIDAFLRTDKPEARYEEWAKHFGRHGVEPYFKTVSNLLTLNEEEIGRVEGEISRLAKIGFTGNLRKLDMLNDHIARLRDNGIELSRIDDGFDENKWVAFVQNLDVLQIEAEEALRASTERRTDVLLALKGSHDLVGFDMYLSIPDEIEKLKKKLAESVDQDRAYDRIAEAEDSITRLKSEIGSKASNIAELRDLKKYFPKYRSVRQAITSSETEFEATESELRRNSKSLASVEETHAAGGRSVEDLAKQISILDTQIKTFPETVNDLERLQTKKKSKKAEAEKIAATLVKLRSSELEPLRANAARAERAIDAIKKETFGIRSLEPDSELIISVRKLRRLRNDAADKQTRIDELDESIANIDSLGSDLESLLTIAMRVIDSTDRADCPVCLTDFGSPQDLNARVRSNKALSFQKRELSEQRKLLVSDVNNLKRALKQLQTTVVDRLTSQKQQTDEQIESVESEELRLIEQQSAIAGEMADLDNRIAVHSTVFLGLSPGVYLRQIGRDQASITRKLNGEKEKQENLATQILTLSRTAAKLTRRIDGLRRKLEKERNDADLLVFERLATAVGLDVPVELSALQANLRAAQDSKSKLESDVAALTKRLRKDREMVAGKRRQRVGLDIANLNESIEMLKTQRSQFEAFLSERLDIKATPRSTLRARLTRSLEKAGNDQELKREVSKLLRKIISMKGSVEPFISYWGNQKRLAQLNEEITLKKKVGEALAVEKIRVGAEIKSSIKAFFHEDLINKFYEIIDPHPFYKAIAFDYDFQSTKPKLDVFVAKEVNDELKVVPNLYLTAAQINVMSLSIFLARSLRATNDKNSLQCIFVDDPIQSMDSINILSTIDLLRSICVNLNKQVILSTHDENFHNLLKRKLPEKRFRSKFIELETYGKVKPLEVR